MQTNHIQFQEDSFMNNTLYNSATVLNTDDTTSLRVGTINNRSEAGKILTDRVIENGNAVFENKVHLMADYNLNTKEFSVLYYLPFELRHQKISLSEVEQRSATRAMKEKFFVSDERFQDFCDQVLKSSDLAITNIYEKANARYITVDGEKRTIDRNQLYRLSKKYLSKDIPVDKFVNEVAFLMSDLEVEAVDIPNTPEEYFFAACLAYTEENGFNALLMEEDDTLIFEYCGTELDEETPEIE